MGCWIICPKVLLAGTVSVMQWQMRLLQLSRMEIAQRIAGRAHVMRPVNSALPVVAHEADDTAKTGS